MGFFSWPLCFNLDPPPYLRPITRLPIVTALGLVLASSYNTWTKPNAHHLAGFEQPFMVGSGDDKYWIVDSIASWERRDGGSNTVMADAITWQLTPRT